MRGDLGRGGDVRGSDFLEACDEGVDVGKVRFGELGDVAVPVVFVEVGG